MRRGLEGVRWAIVGSLVASGLAMTSREARAADIRLRATDDCADRSDIVDQVDGLLGRPVGSVEGFDFDVDITQGADRRWRVRLATVDRADGAKRLRENDSAGCPQLADAAAVAIAMSIQSNAAPAIFTDVIAATIFPAVFWVAGGAEATAPPAGRYCTKMDCADQLTIRLRAANGRPPKDVEIEMEIDGKAVTCRPNPAGAQSDGYQCDQDVTVVHQEIERCRGTTCKGTGSFQQIIEIPSTPKRVRVRVKQDGRLLRTRTFVAQYVRFRPNGPGCPPVCRQATRTWQYR